MCYQTASEIIHLLHNATISGRALQARDIAILVRSGSQARRMQQTLQQFNIPSVSSSAALIGQSPEAADFELLLRAVETLRDETIGAVLAGPFFGYDAAQIAALRNDENGWISLLAAFHEYNRLWNRHAYMHMYRSMREKQDLVRRLSAPPGGLRSITNFQHLAELLQHASISQGLGPAAAIAWLAGLRSGDNGGTQLEQRLESDENAVTIATIHKSKGLEYPVVFVPFSWDVPEPARKTGGILYHEEGRLVLNFSPADETGLNEASTDDFRESLRLFYVALTRPLPDLSSAGAMVQPAGQRL
jgi:exodeoxyribonuclease V beta subunit